MRSRSIDRRRFMAASGRTGLAVCGACLCGRMTSWAEEAAGADQRLDPKKLNYCGYTCPKDCKWVEATRADDVELKKEAWDTWKVEERYGVAFDEAQAFCHGCKAAGKPDGIVVGRCTVRSCAREKGLDCCIECEELATCSHDLWKRFPAFHEQVRGMRERYLKQA